MSKKTINLTPPASKAKNDTINIDKWVLEGSKIEAQTDQSQSEQKEINSSSGKEELSTKRLTITVSEMLHRKIKLFCVENNININDKINEILKKEFLT